MFQIRRNIQEIYITRTRIEWLPFVRPDQYPNLTYFQEKGNKFLQCESVLDWMDIFNGQVTFSSACEYVWGSSETFPTSTIPPFISTAHLSPHTSPPTEMSHTSPNPLLTLTDQVKSSPSTLVPSTPFPKRTTPIFASSSDSGEKWKSTGNDKETITPSSPSNPTLFASSSISDLPDKINVTPLHTSTPRRELPVTPLASRAPSSLAPFPLTLSPRSFVSEKLTFSFSLLGVISFLGNVTLWCIIMKCKLRPRHRGALSHFPSSLYHNPNYELRPRQIHPIFRESVERRGGVEMGATRYEDGEEEEVV